MKRLVSCLLVVMMLIAAVGALAEPAGVGRFGNSDIVARFVKQTDLETKDIALQVAADDQSADLVFRVDRDNLHIVARTNGQEASHIQMNAEGVYLAENGNVTLLRYATVTTALQQIFDTVDAMMDEAIKSIPEDQLPTEEEMKKAVQEMSILAAEAKAQEQADAMTLATAAISFANKFKPEYILDVKDEGDKVTISLRSEAYASAVADAIDELMLNPALADLVNRQAAVEGGKSFAELQKNWAANREATLAAIRTIESTESIGENGHLQSHYQIGEEQSATKILMCDTDAWIDQENGDAEITASLGFKDEDPFLVYELSVDQYAYHEKLSSGDTMTEVDMEFDGNLVNKGKVVTVIEGTEWMRMEVGPDYFYMKGPKGAISTTVRETWSGKIRYEVFAETAEGKQATIIFDFFEEEDSLICEMSTPESEQTATIKISRIEKTDIQDLSTAENLNEITIEKINDELADVLKAVGQQGK